MNSIPTKTQRLIKWAKQQYYFNSLDPGKWLQFVPRRSSLTVGQKIAFGYAIAAIVTFLGTAIGITLGDRYQKQAWQTERYIETEIELLHRLQTIILHTRNRQQQLAALVAQPEQFQHQYTDLLESAAQWEITRLQLQEFVAQTPPPPNRDRLLELLEIDVGAREIYLKQLEETIARLERLPLDSEVAIAAAQMQLLQFNSSSSTARLERLSQEVTDLAATLYRQSDQAHQKARAANTLRLRIMWLATLLSLIVLVSLAFYVSRAIALPLQSLTKVARRVTQSGNFDLQVNITTNDEIGALAESLDRLIACVRELLEKQQTFTAQQLFHSEQMSRLGQMLAGVAYELNNPVNFIYGNLVHAQAYLNDLLLLTQTLRREIPQPPDAVASAIAAIDLDFMEADLPKLLQSMHVGADRVRQIVLCLRNFAHLDREQLDSVDICTCLDGLVLILNNRLKAGIRIERYYQNVPLISAHTGSLYLALMNLLNNAIDAMGNTPQPDKSITLTVKPDLHSNRVAIGIADNGCGIPREHQAKIFEPFFTTKPVGAGTGLGLAITRQIIEEKHGGTVSFRSEVGVGTEFSVILPIEPLKKP
jgi:two-component system NtrC family sensor kinase